MAAKPVVDGFEKQLGKRVRFVRLDMASQNGRKVAAQVGVNMVPLFVGFDKDGMERWRAEGPVNRTQLWARVVSL